MNEPQVSVVIVSYNVKDLLRDCLRSVFREGEEVPLEVIVVDNASHDGSAEMVREEFPQVRLIINDQNLGFAKAANRGTDGTQANYLLYLNPDCIILPGSLSALLNFMRARPEVGIASAKLVDEDGELQYCVSRYLRPWDPIIYGMRAAAHTLRVARYRRSRPKIRVAEDEWVFGACIMVPRDALNAVGMLDERFFLFGEDLDWCTRMKEQGWGVACVASAPVVHKGSGSAPHDYALERRAAALYFRKHWGFLGWGTYALSMMVVGMMAMFRWALVLMVGGEQRRQARERIGLWWRMVVSSVSLGGGAST